MSILPVFHGTVTGGKFRPDNRIAFLSCIAGHEGKRVTVKIAAQTKRRSDNQNRYYWGVVIKIIEDYTGHSPDECHDAMRGMFLRLPGENGFPDTLKSTSKLTTAEFEQYQEKCREWAARALGLRIPMPNEIDLDDL